MHVDELPVEAGVLAAVHGRLPVPTPAVHATGSFERWGYVLMDRMPGVPLSSVWPGLAAPERDALADQLGAAIAALHALAVPEIDEWWPADWAEFVGDQASGCATATAGARARPGLGRPDTVLPRRGAARRGDARAAAHRDPRRAPAGRRRLD
nr:hypothetical protein GCM10020092_026040 [Actinoplanes digitatis]